MDIRINDTPIKQPKNPQLSHYNLTKSGRLASGKMTMELVAKKKKLFFEYDVLSGAEVEHILSLIDGNNMFFNVSYTENGIRRSFRAYVGEISRKLNRGGGNNGWYWTDVSFNLIEQ